jgi:DNA-binding NtrC family response regulator
MARILLAESDEQICKFLAGILADFGHEVITCRNDSEAAVRLAISPVDVLVTDLVLHEEEGSRLSRNCRLRGIPTITLTGQEFHPDRAGQDCPMPLLDKPFRFDDLECVLEAVVAHSRLAQADVQPTKNAA